VQVCAPNWRALMPGGNYDPTDDRHNLSILISDTGARKLLDMLAAAGDDS